MALKLPSTVTDELFIKMPSEGKVVDDDKEWEACGKWILTFPISDLAWADKAWTDLQALLNNGCLLLLKASTAAYNSIRSYEELGTILCFTRPGQAEAIKTAAAIREVVHYENIMYYKSNEATNEGKGRRFGDRKCTQYMHSFLGRFYVRDAIQRWKFVDVSNESGISGRNHGAPETDNFPLELRRLPSSGTVFDLNLYLETDVVAWRKLPEGYFDLKCNSQKEEDGLVEADRVLSAVKSLYANGDFVRVRSYPGTNNKYWNEETAKYIFCYVTDYADSQTLVDIAKRIFKKTGLTSVIYFRVETKVKYVFTPQGEVYEEFEKGIRKFIFNFEKDS